MTYSTYFVCASFIINTFYLLLYFNINKCHLFEKVGSETVFGTHRKMSLQLTGLNG